MSTAKLALEDGALPAKVKYLIAMALDASLGAATGVKSLAQQAMTHGARKMKSSTPSGNVPYLRPGSVYTAAAGLNDVFGNSKSYESFRFKKIDAFTGGYAPAILPVAFIWRVQAISMIRRCRRSPGN